MSKAKKLCKLFFCCFYISAFTFGGGFVIIPLMRKKFVNDLNWLQEQEMLDLTAIAQSSPGAIAVNAAILLGYKVGGVLGTIVAVLATILPPILIISVISAIYSSFRDNTVVAVVLKGMQAGVAAVVCEVSFSMAVDVGKHKNVFLIFVMLLAFILTFVFKVNVIFIVLGGILLAIFVYLLSRRKKKKSDEKVLQEGGISEQEDGNTQDCNLKSLPCAKEEDNVDKDIVQRDKEEE